MHSIRRRIAATAVAFGVTAGAFFGAAGPAYAARNSRWCAFPPWVLAHHDREVAMLYEMALESGCSGPAR